jgi:uncharacterized protein
MSHSNYTYLLHNADKQFDTVTQRHPNAFACTQGCHACCEPALTVLKVEATRIAKFILENPSLQNTLEHIQQSNPHNGTRCEMLNAEGGCSIYPVRPFICRSHGAPIAIAREEYYQIDVCPLNFTDNPIEELGPEDFFILDDWNEQLLDCTDNEERVSLTLSDLIAT